MRKKISVTKMNGERELYNESKLRRSLGNSGADKETIDGIILKVDDFIYGGMETRELFKFVFKELKKSGTNYALKYNIKNALLDLRLEEGYVYDIFVVRILDYEGYKNDLNRIVN